MNTYSMIWAIVNKGYADSVMDAARGAGARGGTIINARGTGNAEITKMLGFVIEPEKDVVMIITDNENTNEILTAINTQAGLLRDAKGIAFALPVDRVVGGAFGNN